MTQPNTFQRMRLPGAETPHLVTHQSSRVPGAKVAMGLRDPKGPGVCGMQHCPSTGMGSRRLVLPLQPPHTCLQCPDSIPSPQLLQFRLHGERECQQSGIQKGIQARFNIERGRALKGVHSFPCFVLCQENRGDGGRGEGAGGTVEKMSWLGPLCLLSHGQPAETGSSPC